MSAISVAPSQNWLGNDGPWSTFILQLGTPPQPIQVLPATSQQAIWTVISYLGCTGIPSSWSQPYCESLRGGVFASNESVTFKTIGGSAGPNLYQLPFEPESPLGGNYTLGAAQAYAGSDQLVLGYDGSGGLTLQNQMIFEYEAKTPYLGVLGLTPRPNNITYADGDPSVLGTLVNQSQVPSSYYAYNAGARYRTPPRLGSLTFGGYDAARGNEKNVLTTSFGPEANRNLLVQLTGVTINGNGSTKVEVPTNTVSFVDSTVPDLWLPTLVCTAFENKFGLEWNEDLNMYLVNDTLHDRLSQMNPSVILSLDVPAGSGLSNGGVNITMPYGAFDLKAQFPNAGILDNTTLRYFPLQRANTTDQLVLGRTFLQEAYLAVDYDRSEFYLSQATFDSDAVDIKTVYRPGEAPFTLSKGAIAGIAVGAAIGGLLLIGLAWWLGRRKYKQNRARKNHQREMSDYTISGSPYGFPPRYYDEYAKQAPPSEVDAADTAKNHHSSLSRMELDALGPARGPANQRYEMESPPPMLSPMSQNSKHVSMDGHISAASEVEATDYWSVRKPNQPPVELPAEIGTERKKGEPQEESTDPIEEAIQKLEGDVPVVRGVEGSSDAAAPHEGEAATKKEYQSRFLP